MGQVAQAIGHMLCAINLDFALAAQGTHLRTDCVLLHQLGHGSFCIACCFSSACMVNNFRRRVVTLIRALVVVLKLGWTSSSLELHSVGLAQEHRLLRKTVL